MKKNNIGYVHVPKDQRQPVQLVSMKEKKSVLFCLSIA